MYCELFEVTSEDENGDPINGEKRLRAFRAGQNFFANRRALILFDEVEDVFNDGNNMYGSKSTAQTRKAWINRMLEENPVPTIWVSNSIDCLDQAFIRRFDMVFKLPVPSKSQREKIIREACQGMLSKESVHRIAEAEELAPAVITRAVAVVQSIRNELGEKNIPSAVEHLLSSTLEAQGYQSLKENNLDRLPKTYDPAFIHADANLVAVAEGLNKTKSGRLCLYGPPGTGKTAFGRWLADKLDLPLSVKRASDLISPYLGMTEHNIAAAFREAEQDKSLLLIDEVDSFLQDRRSAQRSWEVTEVNEMLTQMESFAGVFIASTNLMTGLDQAALRRFDLKVKFDFLRRDQAWSLFKRHCAAVGLPAPSQKHKSQLARLSCLTPGDFAAVARQNRFRPIATPIAFITALGQECLVKEEGQSKAIGFL
jgi:SpoVK/Ycf46/Vps4 family AAA+-type ATPase